MKPQKSSKATKLVSTQIQNKIYKHQTQISEEVAKTLYTFFYKVFGNSKSDTTLKNKQRRHVRLRHADIV